MPNKEITMNSPHDETAKAVCAKVHGDSGVTAVAADVQPRTAGESDVSNPEAPRAARSLEAGMRS
jgi:hypothetical protein